MFLLDTNVVSELMRPKPEPSVEAWVAGRPPKDLFLSAVSEAELRYGAAILPKGRRRATLFSDIEGMLQRAFGDRVLPFDREAARTYGEIGAMRRAVGLLPLPASTAVWSSTVSACATSGTRCSRPAFMRQHSGCGCKNC